MPFRDPNQPIRLLLVEDSPLDAELIFDQLHETGLAIEARRVEDEAGLREALEQFQPDVILSDHSLPGYSGNQALTLVREHNPLTPFIFVSGTLGEDAAIEALRQGANDYILKQNAARLPSAVERALREAWAEQERRQAEAELLRAQRMENLALLTSGLGHDLRNVLQPLLIVPSIIRDHTDKPQLVRLAELVNDCASRGLEMVSSMLSFARGDGDATDTVEIEKLFSALRLMLQGNLPRKVEMRLLQMQSGLSLQANRTELQQSLLNLALNAIQAMPDGGKLTIRAEAIDAGGVCLSVTDTGVGMDGATREKLFTPFFTTKPDGTGLGLHSCRRIVEAHGGWIELDSTPGEGTCFRLFFPATGRSEDTGTQPVAGRGERLLLVDEDAGRMARLARKLEAHGYTVQTAHDGATALQFIQTRGLPELIVMDAKLSLLSTVQTLGELERRRFTGPVLVLNHGEARPDLEDYPAELRLQFLADAEDTAALLQCIRTSLDERAAG